MLCRLEGVPRIRPPPWVRPESVKSRNRLPGEIRLWQGETKANSYTGGEKNIP
jgi:hypothetical protein